jgi:hypothetical protein
MKSRNHDTLTYISIPRLCRYAQLFRLVPFKVDGTAKSAQSADSSPSLSRIAVFACQRRSILGKIV